MRNRRKVALILVPFGVLTKWATIQQAILNGLRRWMREQSKWLLIIDNIESMDTLKGLLPPARRGHILVTTRTQITGTFPKIALQDMLADEGALLLLRRANMLALGADPAGIKADEFEMAKQLAQTLGGLPLALDQAGAYIQETGCGFRGYLEQYERKRAELLKYRGDLSADYPASVATTWSLSFGKVEQASRAAADVLHTCAFLYPDAIPEELFTQGSKELGPALRDISLGIASLDHAMTTLLRYSLLERNPQHKTVRIHRLVQAVLIDTMVQETQRLWAERVVKAVSGCIPLDAIVDQPQQRYALQSQACVQLVDIWDFRFLEAARMVCAAGRYLYLDGYYAQAETLCSRALTMFRNLPETGAEDTYVCLTSLVLLKIDRGNLLEAEVLSKYLLSESEKHFGREHVMTALCLHHLAAIYMKREMFDQAEPLLRRASAIYKSAPSDLNVPTTDMLVSLAKIYNHQGRATEAETLYFEALRSYEKTYGPEHPRVADVLNELAIYYASHQDLVKAERFRQRALAIHTQSLHDEHPDRAITLAGLSATAFSQGRYDEAEKYYKQALAIWERKLRAKRSSEVPNALTAASFEQGAPDKMQTDTFLNLLDDKGESGAKDVITVSTRLADTLLEQKKYEEAGELLWYALESSAKMRGDDDLITTYCTGNLARFYQLRKEYDVTELLYERALQLAGGKFGFNPPGTLRIAENYLQFLKEMGKDHQAANLEEQIERLKRFTG